MFIFVSGCSKKHIYKLHSPLFGNCPLKFGIHLNLRVSAFGFIYTPQQVDVL